MKPIIDASLQRLTRLFFVLLCFWLPFICFLANSNMAKFERESPVHLPFGVFRNKTGNIYIQDFSYNVLYFQGIRKRLVSHPYRLEDQETLIRQMVPGVTAGMSHAYSPVGLVVAFPLLSVTGASAYLIYTSFAVIATLLLFLFHLLPRVEDRLQLYALSAGACGFCLFVAFQLGQSALITTPILGAFWMIIQKRTVSTTLISDALLALLFWMLCLKPSLALIPLFLLLGARAWRVLSIGMSLLLATWVLTSGYYGGFQTGLQDYLHLLNHYNNQGFTPFMQRQDDLPFGDYFSTFDPNLSRDLFFIDRSVVVILNLVLLCFRWINRISASEHFQGAIWAFLLFTPYLGGCEPWVLCLLVIEGQFFKSNEFFSALGKLLLIAGVLFYGTIDSYFVCKWLLFIWTVAEKMSEQTVNTSFYLKSEVR